MKKRLLGFILAICLIIPSTFLMSACGITDVAYVQFIPANETLQVVEYTDTEQGYHIYLLPADYDKNDHSWGNSSLENGYILKISFNQNYGKVDDIDDKMALCVGIGDWRSMEIRVKEEYYYSNPDKTIAKKVYLNGKDITSQAKPAPLTQAPQQTTTSLGSFWSDGVYYFEDFELVKGNTSNFINKIEYK